MVKRHTTLNVEDEILTGAKERGINISAVLDIALRKKLNKVEVDMKQEPTNCEFCGTDEYKKAKVIPRRVGGVLTTTPGLTWIYPDEKWICPSCLKHESMKAMGEKRS